MSARRQVGDIVWVLYDTSGGPPGYAQIRGDGDMPCLGLGDCSDDDCLEVGA